MLDGAAEEFVGLDLDRVAVEPIGPDLDLPGPADLSVEAGEAQTTLLVLLGGVPLDDLGIDEDELLVGLLGVGGEVEDEEPERDAHLVGRQADPLASYISPNIARTVARIACDGRPPPGAVVVAEPLNVVVKPPTLLGSLTLSRPK